jgi:hypothetical protein
MSCELIAQKEASQFHKWNNKTSCNRLKIKKKGSWYEVGMKKEKEEYLSTVIFHILS